MTTFATSANIIHAVTRIGYTGDTTRCNILLPKGRERVVPEIIQRELVFVPAAGALCKKCFEYLEKK